MKRWVMVAAMMLALIACSGGGVSNQESDRQLGIEGPPVMLLRHVPDEVAMSGLSYLKDNPDADLPANWHQGLIVAAWSHLNTGQCDKPYCWMVQLLLPGGSMIAEHIGIPARDSKVDLLPGHDISYHVDGLGLLSLEDHLFVCNARDAIRVS
jgi:hypothetical protein